MQNEPNGAAETKTDSSPFNAPIIIVEAPKLERPSTPAAKEETQPTVSSVPLDNVSLAISQSMNLVDSTATHLHALMKGLTANKPPSDVRAVDIDTAMAAAGVAKQIYSLMRLKLDGAKMLREPRA